MTMPGNATAICALAIWTATVAAMAYSASDTGGFQQTKYGQLKEFETFLSSDRTRDRNRMVPTKSHLQNSFSKMRDIERLLEVRCEADRMTFLLHRSQSIPKLTNKMFKLGRMYIRETGSTVAACAHRYAINREQAMVLTFSYSDCGVHMDRRQSDVVYSTNVVVEFDPISGDANKNGNASQGMREEYTVQCIHPLSTEASNEPALFTFGLSSDKYLQSYWTFPHTIDAGKYVYLSSNVSLPWYKDQSVPVYSFPIDCWSWRGSVSSVEDKEKRRRKCFLRNGCPTIDHSLGGLSRIHHFRGPTKVSILGSNLLFDDGDEHDERTIPTAITERLRNITIGCDLVPCTHSSTVALLNIPKCPSSFYCAGAIGSDSIAAPTQMRVVPRRTAVSGTITVREIIANKGASLAITCKPCQQTSIQFVGPGDQPIDHVDGVQLHIVVSVALVCFIIGIFFMGALWWIHEKTDPTRRDPSQGCQWRNECTDNGNGALLTKETLSSHNKTRMLHIDSDVYIRRDQFVVTASLLPPDIKVDHKDDRTG